ncbi:MAG TPA: bifunctional folylpolyglutamate synthase/dihydrofolate synthase, partial [Thermoplasmata archaeon]|nr:bifunctional folylpolyglutamate synthase/dihydrofolate synthase [Thermoplasmata archaeon]
MDSRHADLLDRAAREGVKPGLDRIAPLTAGIEMPPVIHVAGTNGKGSTVVMLEAILEEHGFSTGAYIQPHLIEPTERIRLRGRDITWDLLDDCLDALLPRIEGMADGPTYFEIFTAAAAIAFSMAGVDVAILETGMGGRLDATNHFPKEVACITRVALDHTAVLGGTVREIAREKAGIVASGVPVVTGASGEALGEIEAAARSAGSPLHVLGRDLLIAGSPGGFSVRFRGTHDGLRTAMDGRHQMENAALAVASAALLVGGLDTAATRRALARASLPGRFQVQAGTTYV